MTAHADWLWLAPRRAAGPAPRVDSATRGALSDCEYHRERRTRANGADPAWVKHHVDAWTTAAAITRGPVFRAIDKAGRVWGDGIAFRGCPVCWVFGLFERASQGFASSAQKDAMTDAVAEPTAPHPERRQGRHRCSPLWACRFRSLAHFHGVALIRLNVREHPRIALGRCDHGGLAGHHARVAQRPRRPRGTSAFRRFHCRLWRPATRGMVRRAITARLLGRHADRAMYC